MIERVLVSCVSRGGHRLNMHRDRIQWFLPISFFLSQLLTVPESPTLQDTAGYAVNVLTSCSETLVCSIWTF